MSDGSTKTIKVDKATHRRLRMVAAATDDTIGDLVRDLSVLAQERMERLSIAIVSGLNAQQVRKVKRDKPKEEAS